MTTAMFNDTMTTMFKQATDSFRSAFETGVRIQSETTKAMFQPLMNDGMADFATRSQKMTEETTRLVQKNFTESQKFMDTQAQKSMDMLKKAFDAATPSEKNDMFTATQNLWQNSFDIMRNSMEEITRTNAQMVENFTQFMTSSCCNNNGAAKKPAAATK